MADAALAELEAFAYSEAAALAAAAEAEDVPAGKRARTGADAAALLAEAERELADSAVEVGESLDANSMKQMVLSIEKRITENSMMRMKYPDAPEKYFDSELGLFQELKRFHVIASAPELYPTFIKTKCLPSLLGLLAHENQDISIDVVDLLHEMCDAEGDPADTLALVELMLEHDAGTLLVQHMSPLKESEPEEAACIHASLSVFESFLESKPESSVDLAQKSGLLKWLLARLKIRAFHANKLYASELLSLLLHRNAENQRTLSDADGVLGLLTAVSQYKRKDPQDAEEAELVENVFDCLSAALEQPRNKLHFLKAEGIELMILTIKERRYASRGALKALAAALHADGASCERFVDIRGFKTLFPLLGAQPPPPPFVTKGAAVERRRAQRCHDLDTAACVCALFSQLEGERRQRLLGKFAEEDYGKLERLLDMHANYDRTLAEAEAAAADAVEEDADDEEYEEAIFAARLDAGLSTMQLVDASLGYIATARHKGLRQGVMQGLFERGGSLHAVHERVRELLHSLGEEPLDDLSRQRLETMCAAVEKLLEKYQPAEAVEEEGVVHDDADGAVHEDADGASG